MYRSFCLGRPLMVVLALAACSDVPTAPEPPTFQVVQAPSANGLPGFALYDTLKLRVVDENGAPQSGVRVTWTVQVGGGSVGSVAQTSDADGIVAAEWTLGPAPGPNELVASVVAGGTATFRVTGEVFKVDKMDATFHLGCGLVDGSVWCWGRYSRVATPPASRLRNPEFHNDWYSDGPGLLDDARPYVDLAVGDGDGSGGEVCALDTGGSVWCSSSSTTPAMVPVAGLPLMRSGLVSDHYEQFCGLALADSTAWCWTQDVVVTPVPGSPSFRRLWMGEVSGGQRACGLLGDETAACWGTSVLGDGSASGSDTPVAVAGGLQFEELAVGNSFTCGRTSAFEVWCWGRTDTGTPLLVPTRVATGVYQIGAGDEAILLLQSLAQGGPLIRNWADLGVPRGDPFEVWGNAPVAGFGPNGIGCLTIAGGKLYCAEIAVDGWTGHRWHWYLPVTPVRRESASVVALQ